MISAAYLRVYTRDDVIRDLPEHVTPAAGERVLRTSDFGVWQESLREDAFRTEWGDGEFVCPRYPKLRMLEGLLAFHNSYPGMVGSMLVPETIVRRAASELETLYEDDPAARSHILTSPWHVPLRWFAAFAPDQRELLQLSSGTSIRYRTDRRSASRRLDRVVRVLSEAGFDDSVVEPVRNLTEWLGEFPADSMVELDYGSVADMFSPGELALDESAADIAASLDALEEGDFEEAGDHYAAAAGRWALAQARMYAN